MGFRFKSLEIPGVILIEPDTYRDSRGFFREAYRREAFGEGGIGREFVQANWSRSRRGVVRGLHYQRDPAAVGKLVWAVTGRVFDVAVDVRPDSPTFGRWVGAELTGDDGESLFIPEGFAHGFCALEDDTTIGYFMTGEYSPHHDAGIRWNDPDIGVDWPVQDPVLSDRDRALPFLSDISEIAAAAKEATR